MLSKTKPQTRDTTEKAKTKTNEGVTVIVLRDGGIQEMTVPASDTELRFLSSALATRDKKRVNATIMGSVADGRIVFFANESIMLASHAASSTNDTQTARVPPSLLPSKLPPMFGPVAIVGFKHAFHAPFSTSSASSASPAPSADTTSQRLQTLSMETYAQVAKITLHASKSAAKAKQTKNTEKTEKATETTTTTKPPKRLKAETETVDERANARATPTPTPKAKANAATEPRMNGKGTQKSTPQLKLKDDDMYESESSESDSENEAALLHELIESDDSD